MDDFKQRDIETADGTVLISRFFEPAGEFKGVVLIVPALGVSQRYYRHFATWLKRQGFAVVTFDYRGSGLSHSGSLRGFKADLFDWARLDCAAMVDRVVASFPDQPLYWVGHSLGGQILPFVPNRERVAKMVTVATGSGYWRENSPPLRRIAWWLWYFVVPVSLRLFGYFPGKRLRKVGDLPRGVMEQWRRWCLDPDYAVGAEGEEVRALFGSVKMPIASFSFTDDEYMSAKNIESIHGFYRGAPKTMTRIAPSDIGTQRIGHFGFFKPIFEGDLWVRYLLPELSEG